MYKVSVIIPVYNSEKFLESTILSVVNQTIGFENIELILVDDNSTDSSKEIIKKFSKQYNNIKGIFLDENHGCPGPARNMGMEKATSEYIMFLDNDDQYEKHLCEKLYETILKTDADLVDCNFKESDNISEEIPVKFDSDADIEIIDEDIVYYDHIYIWTKIFKKDIIAKNNIQFIKEGVNEDSLFCIEYFMHSKRIAVLPNYVGYNHIMHGENISTIKFDYTINILRSYYLILKLLDEGREYDYNKIFAGRIYITLIRTLLLNDGSFNHIKKILKELHDFESNEEFRNIKLDSSLINFLNKLILKKHITITTLIIYLVNKLTKLRFLRKIYRKII